MGQMAQTPGFTRERFNPKFTSDSFSVPTLLFLTKTARLASGEMGWDYLIVYLRTTSGSLLL